MPKGSTIERAVKAVKFIHDHKYWTIRDLADAIGATDPRKARQNYFPSLSRHYPVRKVRTIPNGGGARPALYTIFEA